MPTIVIVEEDDFLANGMKDVIEMTFSHINVEIADNGLDGLTLIRQTRPDLIFCDYQMPELSGLEVLAALNESPDTASIPFVLSTATPQKDLNFAILQRDDRDILKKPFEVADLLKFIRRYIP